MLALCLCTRGQHASLPNSLVFLLCLSLCGMISLESSGVVLVQVFLNRTTATGHGANQDLTTSKK